MISDSGNEEENIDAEIKEINDQILALSEKPDLYSVFDLKAVQ